MTATPPPITTRVRWLYGVGSVAYGVKDAGFAYFLRFYYNQVLGLPGALAGSAILIAMIFDALVDPLIGFWSDSTHSRLGRATRSCTRPRSRSPWRTTSSGTPEAWIEFPENAAPGTVSEAVVANLGLVMGPSLMLLYLCALGSIAFYRISRASHHRDVELLRHRVAAAG